MARYLLFITWLTLCPIVFFGQGGSSFEERFVKAKDLLYDFHPDEALAILLQLEKEDPENANIKYLIGACYTDYQPESSKSIEYLLKARDFVNDNYDADSPTERNASVHLYYFLAVAYAQNHRCDEAKEANQLFRSLIGRISGAYIRDAEFWVKGCFQLEADTSPPPPPEVTKADDPFAIEGAKIVTQPVEYTTSAPIWGVQVGSFSKYIPIGDFDDIKNVDAFIDKNGKVRYVVGSFSLKHQAETLLQVLLESGYKDAYLVDINKERRFRERVITINDVPIRSTVRGKVHFRLQIGAYRDTIPHEMAEKYVKIDGIIENQEKDLTLLSVGRFDTYEDAVTYKGELEKVGIVDAFVVAYNYDEKITLKQAQAYINKRRAESGN